MSGAITKAIFWDYENVPLRNRDWDAFVKGIINFIHWHQTVYAKVYFRKQTPISARDKKIFRSIPGLQFKEIDYEEQNAVDSMLMKSCVDVLKSHPKINHIILISGDGDYLELINGLKERNVRISIICQRQNYCKQLTRKGDRAYSVDHVAHNPRIWWLY